MGNINYVSSTVKILEEPRQTFSKDSVLITQVRAQLSSIRDGNSQSFVTLIFRGKLGQSVKTYYHTNDFLIIEGYISLKNKKERALNLWPFKSVEITVFKVYPFLLGSNSIKHPSELNN